MPRAKTHLEFLTVGQVAKRWGVSPSRIHQLINCGLIPGVFRIPSSGRYGETIKIPFSSVLRLENDQWAIVSEPTLVAEPKPRRRGNDSGPALRHFPKLRANHEPASGSPEAAQD